MDLTKLLFDFKLEATKPTPEDMQRWIEQDRVPDVQEPTQEQYDAFDWASQKAWELIYVE